MMTYLLIAVAVMMFATTAVHLGLPQAIAGVIAKVCKCHKCLSFWLTLTTLILYGCNIVAAMAISIVTAYMSNFFGLLLMWLADKYNDLWQRINKRQKM